MYIGGAQHAFFNVFHCVKYIILSNTMYNHRQVIPPLLDNAIFYIEIFSMFCIKHEELETDTKKCFCNKWGILQN